MKQLIILLTMTLSIFPSCNAQTDKNVEWVEVIGYIRGNPSNYYIYYNVNGVEYRKMYRYLQTMLYEGEKNFIEYNSKNPEEIQILYWKPLFTKGELTQLGEGKINYIQESNIFLKFNCVNFTVNINGLEFERSQRLPPNYKELYPNLEKGQWYEVECWVENPQRAIIHLDKPINNEE